MKELSLDSKKYMDSESGIMFGLWLNAQSYKPERTGFYICILASTSTEKGTYKPRAIDVLEYQVNENEGQGQWMNLQEGFKVTKFAEIFNNGLFEDERTDFAAINYKIINGIIRKRYAQMKKFGCQDNHSKEKWALIIGEECGEIAKAVLENDEDGYMNELIDTAAAIFAAIEAEIKRKQAAKNPQKVVLHFNDNEIGKKLESDWNNQK